MGLLIDTSVLVAAERGLLDLDRLLDDHGGESVALAAISASELLHCVQRLKGIRRARTESFVERVLAALPVVPFDLPLPGCTPSCPPTCARGGPPWVRTT